METGVAVVHHKPIVVEGIVSLIGRTEGFEVVERIHGIGQFHGYIPGPEVGILVLGAGAAGAGLDGPAIAGRTLRSQRTIRILGVFEEADPILIPAMARQVIDGYILEAALFELADRADHPCFTPPGPVSEAAFGDVKVDGWGISGRRSDRLT